MHPSTYGLIGLLAGALIGLEAKHVPDAPPIINAAHASAMPEPIREWRRPVPPVVYPIQERVVVPQTLPNRRRPGILGGTETEPEIHGYPGIWKPPGSRPNDLNIYIEEN